MNPELGNASNFVADMQYGVLDPLHWALQAALGSFNDLTTMTQVYGALCMFLAGLGALVQLLLRKVGPILAAGVAVGVGSSGFFIWVGASWWPLMWSAVWLIWLWNGLSIRRPSGVVLVGFSTAALCASGYPYFLAFGMLLVITFFAERVIRHGSLRSLADQHVIGQLAALFGGLAYALPTLGSMVQSAAWTARAGPEPLLGNSLYGPKSA